LLLSSDYEAWLESRENAEEAEEETG
jgi:hypothetical protein